MTAKNLLLAIFEDLDPAARAVDKLRELGVTDSHVTVISGAPITEAMLGRKPQWSNVTRFALGGAFVGLCVGIFLAYGTPNLYPIIVGGRFIGIPPTIVVMFEMTMLVMLISTFIGVFLDSRYPNYTPTEYVPEISDGRIALLIECGGELEMAVESAMKTIGAESVKRAQAEAI